MALFGPTPRPEDLEAAALRERENELEAIAERERLTEAGVPRPHRIRGFFSRLRRKH
ncbi:MAG: hypothetical protein ACJ77A_05920 [Actinomycetota bacterium]